MANKQPTQRELLEALIRNSTATLSVLNSIADTLCGGVAVPESAPIKNITVVEPPKVSKKSDTKSEPIKGWPTGPVQKGQQWIYTRTSGKAKSTFVYTATKSGEVCKGNYTKKKV